MLRELSIHHVALIDELDIAFYDGFSVLTGETGAGKSIIIEALNFVLGERASRELIQSGASKASVEATFAVAEGEPVLDVLREQELLPEDDALVLYRELSAAGKGVCRVNGTLVSNAVLKSVGDALVDIHGQHAHQALLNPKLHIGMLDAFAGDALLPHKRAVAEAYRRATEAGKRLGAAVMDERERERRCDLLAYQIREIDAAQLADGEEETLLEQRAVLQNAQTIMDALESSGEALSGDESVMSRLSAVMHALNGIASLHRDYAEIAEKLTNAYYELEDVSYGVRDLRNDFSFDEETLNEVEGRLETISTLKKKYGGSIAEVLAYRERAGEEYDALTNIEAERANLQHTYDEAVHAFQTEAETLSKLRKAAAGSLSQRLLPELKDLGMPRASFDVSFTRLSGDAPGADGFDAVEFLLSANAGEPLKALSRVASGGEISRIMLSFKSVLADTDGIATMVFDEIDSGISGQIGTAVADKMRQIADKHQVLCITHLPQIAATANRQYYVYKETIGDATRSNARLLSNEQRVAEIARIMGASESDAIAMEHARRLIASSAERVGQA